jgi:hypothetical protein
MLGARENLKESGFSGSVFTQQCMYFAGRQGKGDVAEGGHAWEVLTNRLNIEQWDGGLGGAVFRQHLCDHSCEMQSGQPVDPNLSNDAFDRALDPTVLWTKQPKRQ